MDSLLRKKFSLISPEQNENQIPKQNNNLGVKHQNQIHNNNKGENKSKILQKVELMPMFDVSKHLGSPHPKKKCGLKVKSKNNKNVPSIHNSFKDLFTNKMDLSSNNISEKEKEKENMVSSHKIKIGETPAIINIHVHMKEHGEKICKKCKSCIKKRKRSGRRKGSQKKKPSKK